MTSEASKAAAILGKLGGAKGGKATGKSKVRGDSAYYKALRAKRKCYFPIGSCCFCGHSIHGPGGCDNCASLTGCNQPPY